MSKPIKWILIFKFGEQMNISLNYATSLFMLKKERKKKPDHLCDSALTKYNFLMFSTF